MNMRIASAVALGLLSLVVGALFGGPAKEDRSLTLDLGNASYRGKSLDIAPGVITSAKTGKPVPLDRMARDLAACRFVYIGETHNSLPNHEIQCSIIKALYALDRNIAIGLEMFPAALEEPLAKWSRGLLSEEEFLSAGQWYINWNFNFGYYRPIFDFAKEMNIPIHGLNVAREIITKIRMGGWDSLSDDQKKLVPPLDLSKADHRTLIRTIFESTELPPQMKGMGLDMVFEGLYRSQVAWDEVMAANARRVAEAENKRVVVLAGSGHLLYNLGINGRVFERDRRPFRTVVCVAVPAGQKSLKVARGLADFIWGIPPEKRPAFPEIGLAFKKFEDLTNLVIERKPTDGAAASSDFEKGDIILSVNGKPYADINFLRMDLARFAWDEEIKFRILRAGQEKDVILKLAQTPAADADK